MKERPKQRSVFTKKLLITLYVTLLALVILAVPFWLLAKKYENPSKENTIWAQGNAVSVQGYFNPENLDIELSAGVLLTVPGHPGLERVDNYIPFTYEELQERLDGQELEIQYMPQNDFITYIKLQDTEIDLTVWTAEVCKEYRKVSLMLYLLCGIFPCAFAVNYLRPQNNKGKRRK